MMRSATSAKRQLFPNKQGGVNWKQKAVGLKGHMALLWGQHAPVSAGEAEGEAKKQ